MLQSIPNVWFLAASVFNFAHLLVTLYETFQDSKEVRNYTVPIANCRKSTDGIELSDASNDSAAGDRGMVGDRDEPYLDLSMCLH